MTVLTSRTSAALWILALVAGGTPLDEFVADDSSLAQSAIDLGRVAVDAQITDAHLVNLAASSGSVLATMDAGILDMLAPDDRRHVLVLPDRVVTPPRQ